jgi:hypothetical protein
MRINDFANLPLVEHPKNPILLPPWPSPILADPTFLPPSETPDGRWHLFAHTLFGIEHYSGLDGLVWQRHERLCGNALRCFLLKHDGTFFLYYEKCNLMLPIVPGLAWSSHIEVRVSSDLWRFSEPMKVLAPCLPWHHEPGRGQAVGNPCVVPVGDTLRMYYSAGLVFLPDCGFCEPRFIGVAEAQSPLGPFVPASAPLLGEQGTAPHQVGAGAIKVLRADDGFVGFQNAIYWVPDRAVSGSAIYMLGSSDGLSDFRPLRDQPILAPKPGGFMQSHVYALDARVVQGGLRVYFNARDRSHWLVGKEAIGLLATQSV